MSENRPDFDEIRDRLERMERALRRWRVGAAIVALLAVVVVAAGAMAEPTKELSLQTLMLVDQHGKERIVLTAREGVPDMTFLDPSGKGRLTLDITDDRVPVLLFSESGEEKNGLTLGFGEDGPMMQLFDVNGKKRITLAAPPKGKPYLRFLDEQGKLLSRFP